MALARWHSGTKAQTLEFLLEAKRIFPGISDEISVMEKEEHIIDWDVCVLECRICGSRQTGIVPREMANENNECVNCGNMTADVIEDDE